MHTEVATLIDRLRSIVQSAETLIAHAEDLHVLAYDRPAADDVKVRASGLPDPIPGDPRARVIFGKLFARTREVESMMTGFRVAILNALNVGDQRPEMFGTRISAADFARAIKAQRRRDERGEYTPAKNLPQPRYPGKGGAA